MKKDKRTVAVKLRFWATGLELSINGVREVACRDSGNASIEANKTMGIRAEKAIFASYEDIIPAIKELFRKNHIHVVSNNRRPRIT